MRRALIFITVLFSVLTVVAGYKVKLVKPKKPSQYQASTTVDGVTYSADLLLEGKNQKDYFCKELTPSNVIAVRLAVFNSGKLEVLLPLDGIQLLPPEGEGLALLAPDTVAQAVLQGLMVTAEMKDKRQVAVSPNVRSGDPRYDRTDPRYDPRLDPNDPSYDPRDPRNRRSGGQNGPWGRPGVDVVMNPGGGAGGGGDLSQFEKQLVEKDFQDMAHGAEPVAPSLTRDKFLYFSMAKPPSSPKGFVLRIPASKGIPQEVLLKF